MIQGQTNKSAPPSHLVPTVSVNICPGHSTPPDEEEKRVRGRVASPEDWLHVARRHANTTLAHFLTESEKYDIIYLHGAETAKVAFATFDVCGWSLVDLDDVGIQALGGDPGRSRVHNGGNGTRWGAKVMVHPDRLPMFITVAPNLGTNILGLSGGMGQSVVCDMMLELINLERALRGDERIAPDDSLLRTMIFNPARAQRLATVVKEGDTTWVTPSVRGGRASGARVKHALEAYVAARRPGATQAEKDAAKAVKAYAESILAGLEKGRATRADQDAIVRLVEAMRDVGVEPDAEVRVAYDAALPSVLARRLSLEKGRATTGDQDAIVRLVEAMRDVGDEPDAEVRVAYDAALPSVLARRLGRRLGLQKGRAARAEKVAFVRQVEAMRDVGVEPDAEVRVAYDAARAVLNNQAAGLEAHNAARRKAAGVSLSTSDAITQVLRSAGGPLDTSQISKKIAVAGSASYKQATVLRTLKRGADRPGKRGMWKVVDKIGVTTSWELIARQAPSDVSASDCVAARDAPPSYATVVRDDPTAAASVRAPVPVAAVAAVAVAPSGAAHTSGAPSSASAGGRSYVSEALEARARAPASARAAASARAPACAALPDIGIMAKDAMTKELRDRWNVKGCSKMTLVDLRKRLAAARAVVANTPSITGFFGKAPKSGSGRG